MNTDSRYQRHPSDEAFEPEWEKFANEQDLVSSYEFEIADRFFSAGFEAGIARGGSSEGTRNGLARPGSKERASASQEGGVTNRPVASNTTSKGNGAR